MEKLRRITAPLAQESAVALGFFDGVHLGHRAVLGAAAQCAAAQGLMACAFTFAADSVSVKQGVPLTYLYTDAQKAELMQDCGIHGVYCPAFSELCALDGESFCRQVLGELLHMQEAPIKLLAVLGKQLRQLYTARLAIEHRKGVPYLMELWGMRSAYPAERLMQSARRFSLPWCRRAVLRCGQTDLAMKSTGADGEELLIGLLMELAVKKGA